jgi:hypothetical protein
MLRIVCALSAALSLAACSGSAPVPPLDLASGVFPSIAAEFRTSVVVAGDSHRGSEVSWRVWREPNRVVIEDITANTGAIWQRDGGSLFLQKVFHDDRKSVEYQMDDLQMSGVETGSLLRQSLLVDPALLQQLTLKKSGWKDGVPLQRYAGKVGDQTWDITLRTDLSIPVSIDVLTPTRRERTQLIASHFLEQSPWTPTSSVAYDIMEFADLGDRQSDPFVAKVQNELGVPHAH